MTKAESAMAHEKAEVVMLARRNDDQTLYSLAIEPNAY